MPLICSELKFDRIVKEIDHIAILGKDIVLLIKLCNGVVGIVKLHRQGKEVFADLTHTVLVHTKKRYRVLHSILTAVFTPDLRHSCGEYLFLLFCKL